VIPALGKKTVSVGPGQRAVTEMAVSSNSMASASLHEDESFGGVINGQQWTWFETGNRRCVERPTSPELDHQRQEKLRQVQNSFNVQADRRDIMLNRNLPTLSAKAKSGVVDVNAVTPKGVKDFPEAALVSRGQPLSLTPSWTSP
jgi:hypothetical protein